MKRIAIVLATLALVGTGIAFGAPQATSDCTCQNTGAARTMQLGSHELTP